MDKHTISENQSSWIRAASGAIGVLLLSVYVLSNSDNEKSSTLAQEAKTAEMRNIEKPSPDRIESEEKLTVDVKKYSIDIKTD
jgi:hypothetical protein